MSSNKPYAEVIESSLRFFTAQCWSCDIVPAFGSLCIISLDQIHPRTTIIAIVHQIQTGSADPSRRVTPYQKTPQQLREQHPQIFAFLQTTFCATVLAHVQAGNIQYELAPRPVPVHAFIAPIERELAQHFFSKLQFMHLLTAACEQLGILDDLLIALATHALERSWSHPSILGNIMEEFAVLARHDYQRLRSFAQRIESLV